MRRHSCIALVTAIILGAGGCTRAGDPQVVAGLRLWTEATAAPFVETGRRGQTTWRQTGEFYSRRGFLPAWTAAGRPTAAFDALLGALRDAHQHGLDPRHYGLDLLAAERERAGEGWLWPRFVRDRIAEIEVRATYAYLRLATDLRDGRVQPRSVDRRWSATAKADDLLASLQPALDGNRVAETLATFVPVHPQYRGLQAALAERRAGLGSATNRRLASWRLAQLEVNLDRWRWLPRDLGDRHILVNIPAYELDVVEAGRSALSMRVIVGSPANPTPVFSDRMAYIAFSPYWNIPESIMRAETLPRAAEDPSYLQASGIEVVRAAGRHAEPVDPADVDWTMDLTEQGLRLRQIPGPENALGLVKFIFPNHFNVYLHDTPTDALFRRSRRALSHGCVRLERPLALAAYVLSDQPSWDRARIQAAMSSQQESAVRLKEPVSVHLGYWTAWVEADGRVRFTDDPYNVDVRHARAWKEAARTYLFGTYRSVN